MKTIISLALALTAVPVGSAIGGPDLATSTPPTNPGSVAGILPDPPPRLGDAHLRARVIRLSADTRRHAARLGLGIPPTIHPARSGEALAVQERRLTRIAGFLAHRAEVDLAVDERRSASPGRTRTSNTRRLARAHTRVARLAARLGIDRPARPRPASTRKGRAEQIERLRTVAGWLSGRSERIRPHERPLADRVPHYGELMCIAGHESSHTWDISTGNGYYGGLQMDRQFQRTYSPGLYRSKGTADNWTAEEQLLTAAKAVATRGFWPWPNTARMCGLL